MDVATLSGKNPLLINSTGAAEVRSCHSDFAINSKYFPSSVKLQVPEG